MKIGFDVTQAAKQGGRGIAHYIRALLPELMKAMPELEPVLFLRDQRWWKRELLEDLIPGAEIRPLIGPLDSPGRDLDLFHSMGNHLPWRSPIPRSFTLHDLRILDSGGNRWFPSRRTHRNVHRASGIVLDSEYGKSRLLHHFPSFPPEKAAAVPLGVDLDRFAPRDSEESSAAAVRFGLSPPFLLQVGAWFPHKNLELSIRAFAKSDARTRGFRLVFVGGNAPPSYEKMLRELAATEGVSESIDWIENVPDKQLPGLFSAASALLQPSFYEGFGLPILEAMATGTPGVVAEASCLPEIAGGIWPSAPPDDPESFAAAIDTIALEGMEREQAISFGRKKALEYSWRRTAESTALFLRTLTESAGSPSC
ncbi:MAG: hypothetical protein CMJ96_00530 [Planctomycetes bacterium]|nr:hypothetical protein [Planctomycetota bacterium]MDP6128981.1 glycosyltransferase family 1 protein [Planctomycetota bacterium]MDP7246478.1 glycosyltransferase family 1 protein [Planctomycetota bacterium]MDP7560195.1 glycosyltransferase family 1 protein [Planctomycetota bacterium]|tara:strand:- start:2409 stop:3512 length:1104 start_codon:yes stop_codon:yes gene_type:complete